MSAVAGEDRLRIAEGRATLSVHDVINHDLPLDPLETIALLDPVRFWLLPFRQPRLLTLDAPSLSLLALNGSRLSTLEATLTLNGSRLLTPETTSLLALETARLLAFGIPSLLALEPARLLPLDALHLRRGKTAAVAATAATTAREDRRSSATAVARAATAAAGNGGRTASTAVAAIAVAAAGDCSRRIAAALFVAAAGPRNRRGSNRQRSDARCKKQPRHRNFSFDR